MLVFALQNQPAIASPDALPNSRHPSPFIDSTHPVIQQKAMELTATLSNDQAKAIAIHDFVRDAIQFGFPAPFYEMKASDVLVARVGFCTPKTTLFIALLRAAGIPARQRFVDISVEILHGLVNPGTPFLDHSYAEVFVHDRWIRVDSYIVDPFLYRTAQDQLAKEGRIIGYGVHRDGSMEWDGVHDSFVQFVNNGTFTQLTTRDYGSYQDIGDFYAQVSGWNKKTFLKDLLFRFFHKTANKRIESLRTAPPGEERA